MLRKMKRRQNRQQAQPAAAQALPEQVLPVLSVPILSEEEIVLKKKFLDYLKEIFATAIDLNSSIAEEGLAFFPSLRNKLTPTSTYLHAAVLAQEPEQVAFLLEHGAEVNKLDAENNSAWAIAMMLYSKTNPSNPQLLEIFKILLQHGAALSPAQSRFFDANLSKEIDKDSCQRTHFARNQIKEYLESGKKIDELSDRGQSLLHTAVTEEALEMIILLLEYEADPNCENINKKSAMQLMIDKIQRKIDSRPNVDRRRDPSWGSGCYELGCFRQEISITLGNIDKKLKEICIWLLRYGAALDKAHHSNFMIMGIDLIAIREEQMIYSTKLAKRAELLNKKSAEDRIELREQVDELQGYVKEDIHMLKGIILNMVDRIEGLQQDVLLLREDNRLLREDNQRLNERLTVVNERTLPEPQRANQLTYRQAPSLTFFTREEAQEQAPNHSITYSEGLN